MADHLPTVELVTRPLDTASDLGAHPCEVVEAVRVDGGPRLEVPLGSRVAVEHEAGEGVPVVHVELLAARVRYVDRATVHDPPDPDRTRQLLLAAAVVLQGGQVPAHLHAETGGDHVSRLGRLLEEHALAHAAPVPPLPATAGTTGTVTVPLDHGVALHHPDCAPCLEVARALCLARPAPGALDEPG